MTRSALLGGSAAALLVGVGFAKGGWEPDTWRLATIAICCSLAAVLLTKERLTLSPTQVVAVCSLAGLAGWMLLSQLWSAHPALAAPEAERCALYASALLMISLAAEAGTGRFLTGAVIVGVGVLSVWALVDYLFRSQPSSNHGLLVGPVWYANGEGVLAAMAVMLVLADARPRSGARWAALGALLVALLVVLGLTRSWGAWAALVAAIVVSLAWTGRFRLLALAGSATVLALGMTWAVRPETFSSIRHNPRWHYWSAAVRLFADHPVGGSGAGTYGGYLAAHPGSGRLALDAHNLYLETLAELGPLGLALILVFAGSVLLAVFGTRRALPLGAAAFLVYLLHAALDWDWELPVVTLAGLLTAGAVLVDTRGAGALVLNARARVGILVSVVGLAAVEAVRIT